MCQTRELSATRLPVGTIIVPVDKGYPMLDIPTDITFSGSARAEINKFPENIQNVVVGRDLEFNMPHNWSL